MASSELRWAKSLIASSRKSAGVSDDLYDVRAARASLRPLDMELPDNLVEIDVFCQFVRMKWVHVSGADGNKRIVYLHGGGYLAGGYHSHRHLVAWLAQVTNASVLFVEYRLAPEARFPAAQEDARMAVEYAYEHGPASAAPRGPLRVFVGGDSAGGGIAIATLLHRRDSGAAMPVAGFALCGMLDVDENSSKFLQSSQRTRDSVRFVVSSLKDLQHPYLNVVRADLVGLPPLLLQTGAEDYCRDDSIEFARRAEEAQVQVTLDIWPEMFHVWQRFAPKVPEALQALKAVAQFLDTALLSIHEEA
jgi:epsilon-lactone hydrolase